MNKKTRNRQPTISVIMPVYNAEKYLDNAIKSVLKQSFKDFEFIVVDDGSTDSSWAIIEKYKKNDSRIFAIKNSTNLRTTKTLNRGLKISKGKYIVRCDADDWNYPYRFSEQVKYMKIHPKVGVSGGTIQVCDDNLNVLNKREYPTSDSGCRKIIFRYSPFAHPATIWDAKTLKKLGGYNENIPLSQDYELYFRVGRNNKFGNLKKVLIKLRTHSDSSSIVKGRYQEQYAIYCRIKAFLEYGYTMSSFDKLYTFIQMLSMVIIPPKVKFWVFNFLRRAK